MKVNYLCIHVPCYIRRACALCSQLLELKPSSSLQSKVYVWRPGGKDRCSKGESQI